MSDFKIEAYNYVHFQKDMHTTYAKILGIFCKVQRFSFCLRTCFYHKGNTLSFIQNTSMVSGMF